MKLKDDTEIQALDVKNDTVVNVVQTAFRQGQLRERFSIGIFVLIPKDKSREYRGITFLETLYKLISRIIGDNNRSINFHDAVHGFRPGRSTITVITELKLFTSMNRSHLNTK